MPNFGKGVFMKWIKKQNVLTKTFKSKSSSQTAQLINLSKNLFKKVRHDPHKIEIKNKDIKFELTTHEAGNKVTFRDFRLATELDALFDNNLGRIKTLPLNAKLAKQVWRKLFFKQYNDLKNKAHPFFWQGLKCLKLSDNLPGLKFLNRNLKICANFQMQKTNIQYAGDVDWFRFLSKRQIMVTKFIRAQTDLDYTPLPDFFHDIFGHWPMLANNEVADLAEKFGRTFLQSQTDRQRFMVERLWWNSLEFGFMNYKKKNLIIGAGLVSSGGERQHALSKKTKFRKFKTCLLEELERSPHEFHSTYVVFRSFKQIAKALDWIVINP